MRVLRLAALAWPTAAGRTARSARRASRPPWPPRSGRARAGGSAPRSRAKASSAAQRPAPPRRARARDDARLAVGVVEGLEARARGSAGSRSSVSSMTAAMPRNARRPARNAWTATSLAALSTHGAGAARRSRRRARGAGGERLDVGRLEGQRTELGEVERPHGDVDPLGVVQRIGDRHAHVRVAEVRERGAVAEQDERVDDRLRVHDDVDVLVGHAEEVVGLDDLEALVHQRRRVDGDLAAHGPRRVLRAPPRR